MAVCHSHFRRKIAPSFGLRLGKSDKTPEISGIFDLSGQSLNRVRLSLSHMV